MKNKILVISTCDPEKTAVLLADCHSELQTKNLYFKDKRSFANAQDDIKIIAKKVWRARTHQSEELLLEIDKLLKENKVRTENLGLIIVNVGPGSFTGTRVGVAVANALAFSLDISVIGVKNQEKIEDILKSGLKLFAKGENEKGNFAKPFYNQAPNITKPKLNKKE